MDAKTLAEALGPLLCKINVPMTPDNAKVTLAIYETLGAMAQGALRFVEPSKE